MVRVHWACVCVGILAGDRMKGEVYSSASQIEMESNILVVWLGIILMGIGVISTLVVIFL